MVILTPFILHSQINEGHFLTELDDNEFLLSDSLKPIIVNIKNENFYKVIDTIKYYTESCFFYQKSIPFYIEIIPKYDTLLNCILWIKIKQYDNLNYYNYSSMPNLYGVFFYDNILFIIRKDPYIERCMTVLNTIFSKTSTRYALFNELINLKKQNENSEFLIDPLNPFKLSDELELYFKMESGDFILFDKKLCYQNENEIPTISDWNYNYTDKMRYSGMVQLNNKEVDTVIRGYVEFYVEFKNSDNNNLKVKKINRLSQLKIFNSNFEWTYGINYLTDENKNIVNFYKEILSPSVYKLKFTTPKQKRNIKPSKNELIGFYFILNPVNK